MGSMFAYQFEDDETTKYIKKSSIFITYLLKNMSLNKQLCKCNEHLNIIANIIKRPIKKKNDFDKNY